MTSLEVLVAELNKILESQRQREVQHYRRVEDAAWGGFLTSAAPPQGQELANEIRDMLRRIGA